MQLQTIFFVLCGILSVKGTPFYPDSSIDLLKLHEFNATHELNSNNNTLLISNPNITVEVVSEQENIQVADGPELIDDSIESIEAIEEHHPSHSHNHGNGHGHGPNHRPPHHHEHEAIKPASQLGPVEMSLRNVVSASAIATEELFMEAAALSSEISDMFKTKSEILTSHAMNTIFKPLNTAENEIKKSQECGREFVETFNSVLSQINSGLKSCVHNLTHIDEGYRNQSTQILISISKVADDIKDLPESCELNKSFTLGTFCIINNLAEANERVVLNVKNIKFISSVAKEVLLKASESSVACQKRLVEAATRKLDMLADEVVQTCTGQVQQQNIEI